MLELFTSLLTAENDWEWIQSIKEKINMDSTFPFIASVLGVGAIGNSALKSTNKALKLVTHSAMTLALMTATIALNGWAFTNLVYWLTTLTKHQEINEAAKRHMNHLLQNTTQHFELESRLAIIQDVLNNKSINDYFESMSIEDIDTLENNIKEAVNGMRSIIPICVKRVQNYFIHTEGLYNYSQMDLKTVNLAHIQQIGDDAKNVKDAYTQFLNLLYEDIPKNIQPINIEAVIDLIVSQDPSTMSQMGIMWLYNWLALFTTFLFFFGMQSVMFGSLFGCARSRNSRSNDD